MPFSPWSLRPALAALREQGERPLAWAPANQQSPASLALFRLALAVIPGVGQALSVLAAAAFGPRPRLFVLTETALLVFAEERGPAGERTPVLERCVPVEHLTVRVGGLGLSFNLSFAPGEPLRSFAIDPNHSACTARLCRGLVLLARGPGPPDAAPPPVPALAAGSLLLAPIHGAATLHAGSGPFVS